MSRFHGNIPTRKQLQKYYIEENLPLKYVAKRLNTSEYTVRKMLVEYGIPVRTGRPKPTKKTSSKQSSKQLPEHQDMPPQEPLITVHAGGKVEGNYWENLAKFEANASNARAGGQHGQAITRQRKPRGTKLG